MRDQPIRKALKFMLASAGILISLALGGSEQIASAQEPQPVKAVSPVYPVMALNASISGTVIVAVQVNQYGVVTSVRTLSGPELLRKVSERAASRWRFRSTGEPGSRREELTFVFTLMQGSPPSEELVPIFLPPYHIEVKGTKPNLIQRIDSDPPRLRKSRHHKRKRMR